MRRLVHFRHSDDIWRDFGELVPGGPAAEAGLLGGDLIVSVDVGPG